MLGLLEYFILEMYISGLKEEIQSDVILGKPNDIHEVFELSLMLEAKKGANPITNPLSLNKIS